MSDEALAWPARTLAPNELTKRYEEVRSYRKLMDDTNRAMRRLCLAIAGGGAALAAVSIAAAALVVVSKPQPPAPGFIEVDRSTGYVGFAMPAKDAPRLFNERVAEHYLYDYIMACMSYVPETFAVTFHQCAAMSAPEQQARLAARVSPKNPDAPENVYGAKGYAVPSNFKFYAAGDGKFQTKKYAAHFYMTEVEANRPVHRRSYSAAIDFQWHPELAMSNADRMFNEAGLQVLSFTADPDPGQ